MKAAKDIRLAFYGDDFTGSTDALEFAARAGAKAVLFIEPPGADMAERFHYVDVIGIAGKTRALSPEHMNSILLPAFVALQKLKPHHVHYKVCSTFDSSPHTGNIGMAIECGAAVFGGRNIPIIGGAPVLGRYCVFGNLFASMGIGSNGKIYRLDRHPSMSRHPVTPADESDLRLHLGKQTSLPVGLIDVLQLDRPSATWNEQLLENKIVLFDALTDNHLEAIGNWLFEQKDAVPFSVGGSSVEMALGFAWQKNNLVKAKMNWISPGVASPLMVISGSCSPVTTAQIEWAKSHGFKEIVIDARSIADSGGIDEIAANTAIAYLGEGHHVIVHTGPVLPRNLSSEKLGTSLGLIALQAMTSSPLKRLVVAGGDTSSYAARALQIEAVEMIAPLVIGAPLCKAYSSNPVIDGLEVNFKGGQVGAEDYFGVLQQGEWNF